MKSIYERLFQKMEKVRKMNDEELLYLKFKKRFSTQQLLKRFPYEKKRIAEVALLDVSDRLLYKIVKGEKILSRLTRLKKKFHQIDNITKTWEAIQLRKVEKGERR